ncbi:MAG TPA: hypothetical protein PKH16_10015 [Aequorivita sp.]|nr:hypothetical protein [Aequorivita sp.]
MTLTDIDKAISKILASDELQKNAGIDKRLKYELLNQDKRIVSVSKKLEILWKVGMLKLTDGTK